jgi:hypothetical protein
MVPGCPWWFLFLLVPDGKKFYGGLSPFEFPGCQNLVALPLAFGFVVWCRFALAMAESGGPINYYATYLPNMGADPHLDSYSSTSLASGWLFVWNWAYGSARLSWDWLTTNSIQLLTWFMNYCPESRRVISAE